MKRVLALVLMLAICVVSAAGCTKISKDDPAQRGAEIEMYMGTKVMDLDPAVAYTDENAVKILSLIFEGLTKIDENGKLQKALAKKWEITENPKTGAQRLEITINDTYWSDGSMVQANDVIYAWKRILDPSFDSPAASMLYCIKGAKDAKMGLISIDDIELYSVSKSKFIIEFEEGTDIDEFLYNTASPALVPLRENKVASYPDSWSKSATDLSTNGPFRVKKFSSGPTEQVVLERSKYYYLSQEVETEAIDKYVTPYRITIRYDVPLDKTLVYSSAETDVLTMYNNKELFYISGLTASTAAAYGKSVKTEAEASTFVYYFNLNSRDNAKLFQNAAVREALSMALDRNYIAELVGCGTEAATGLLNDQVFNTKKGTSFRKSGGEIISAAGDIEGAKQLLADNDIWPEDYDDIYILIRMDEMNDSYQSQQMGYMSKEKAVAQYTKTVWEELGFHVVVNAVASSTYEELYAAGDYDVIGLDYQMLSVYPLYNLTAFTKEYNGHVKLVTSADRDFDASRGETMYYESVAHVSGYYNAEYDALIASAFAETDAKKRAEILHEAEALLLSDAVVVPLLFNANAYVVSSELSKVSTNYWGVQIFTKTELKNYVQYLSSVREAAQKEEENQ